MQPTTNEIIQMEWKMFDAVQNRGGRADCQDDPETFRIMRGSQLDAWTEAMRVSYRNDLQKAQQAGRNLLTEKYARMMEYTVPTEYETIKNQLPPLEPGAKELIDSITAAQVKWLEDFAGQYPCVAGRGRPIHSREDSPYGTSFETYLRGELSTYSLETLQQYQAYVTTLLKDGKNLSEMILRNTAREYGYSSLDEAESILSARQRQ
jgi:hypothetical protein